MLLSNILSWAKENPVEVLGGTIITFLSGMGTKGILKSAISMGSGSSSLIIGGLSLLVGGLVTKYCVENHANRENIRNVEELRADLAAQKKQQESQIQINAERLSALQQNAETLQKQQELILKLQALAARDPEVPEERLAQVEGDAEQRLFKRKPVRQRVVGGGNGAVDIPAMQASARLS